MLGKRKNIDKILDKNPAPARRGKRRLKKVLLVIGIIVIVGLLAGLGYYAWDANKKLKALSDPKAQEEMAKKETDMYVSKMKKHIVLPTGETPTMATITDINALKKEQPFYDGASNGDVIIIYAKAKQGFVYDPKRDLIVKVGPVFIDESQTNADGSNATPSDSSTTGTTDNTGTYNSLDTSGGTTGTGTGTGTGGGTTGTNPLGQ